MATESVTYECTEQEMQEQGMPNDQQQAGMKKCPFCAEQIQAEAIKCRYCGEFLDGSGRSSVRPQSKKWYYSTSALVLLLLCLGPLALPLVWRNPRFKPLTKAIVTIIVLVVTAWCVYKAISLFQQFFNQLDALGM